jgi:hypothetical protein
MRRGNTRKGGVNWKRVMLDFKGFWKTRHHDDDERSTTLVKSELKVLYIYMYIYIYIYVYVHDWRKIIEGHAKCAHAPFVYANVVSL